jgi:4-aminobutyrate--pyruvate transaminase
MISPTDLRSIDARHHVHGQTDLRTHAEDGPSAMVVGGKGVWITTDDGQELIDGFSGLGCTSLGYDNERIANAAHQQLTTLPYAPTFYGRTHPKVAALAERLVHLAPGEMSRVIFQCSGSEATDTLIKFLWARNTARGEPERRTFISRWRGYYGNTVASVSLSGQPHMHAKFGLPLEGFVKTETPNYYLNHEDGETEEEFSQRMADDLEQVILASGPEHIAAFAAEPMQSGGGAIKPPEGYWPRMQAVLRKYDIHFHVDEVVCGFGRTGNRWGSETWGLEPDTISCAKALTAGFFPMSALLFKEDLYQDLEANADEIGVLGHGYTYSGHPVGAAIAMEALDIYEDIDLVGHVRSVSSGFLAGCEALMDHPLVGDVRGVGLFCGIQLVEDKATRALFDPAMKVGQRVQDHAHARGLYLRAIAPDRISFMPPLIIAEDEIVEATARLRAALDDTWKDLRS